MGNVASSTTIFEAHGAIRTSGPISNFRLTFLQQYAPVSDPNIISRTVKVTNPSSSVGEYLGNITVDSCNAVSAATLSALGFVFSNAVGYPSEATCHKVFTLNMINLSSTGDIPSMTVTRTITKDQDNFQTELYYGTRPVYAGETKSYSYSGQSMEDERRYFGPGDIFHITISLPTAGLWVWRFTLQNKVDYDEAGTFNTL